MYNTTSTFWATVENLDSVAKGERVILAKRLFVLGKSINNVFALPKDALVSPLEMISERGFPLLKQYSVIIQRMIDGGLITKIYNDFIYNVTVLHHIREHETSGEKGPTALAVDHLDGAFTILLLGLAVSAVVFFIELFIDWYVRHGKARRLWKLFRNSWRQVSIMRRTKLKRLKETRNVIWGRKININETQINTSRNKFVK